MRSEGSALYRAVWRWHFYAGLIVLPFLLWLAVTGGLYLYKPEIEALVYRPWATVTPTPAPLPIDRMITAVERQSGAHVTQVMRPAEATASWRMTLVAGDGGKRLAFVDPYRGRVLGTTAPGGVMQVVRDLHSLAITGPIGNALIEIVAGWAVLLVASGLYLWWPRRGSPAIGLRGRPAGRLFWRDLHASTGLLASAVILFLAITGMPWTGVAGRGLQGWVSANGLGRPAAPGGAGHDHGAAQSLPWSMQGRALHGGHGGGDIGVARAAGIAAARGLAPPWTMTLPAQAHAPYVVSHAIVRAEDARVLTIDGGSGAVLLDARYAGFGPGARVIEWGIATHQGQEYGEPNRLLMLAGCIVLALLALSAPVLWWKRRRGGRLEAPPRGAGRGAGAAVIALIVLAAAFPLTLATVVIAAAADLAAVRLRARRG